MTPYESALTRAVHDVHVPAAPQIGGGAKVVLYTSADCWRGAGVSYVAIARGLEAHGFQPVVASTCDEVTHEFLSAGLTVIPLPRGRGEAMRLRTLLARSQADAVLVDRAHDLRVGALAVAGTRRPLLFRYNHFAAAPPSDLLVRVAYRGLLSSVVFLSSVARERVLRDTPFMRRVPPTTIHEGVDADTFHPCARAATEFRRTYSLGAEPFLLAVGALSPEKQYRVMFDALHLCRDSVPQLLLFGEGRLEPELRARAEALGLRVRFAGRVSQRTLVGAYNASTALLHTGAVETFGLSILEAMACGRPVIASSGGAIPEVIGTDGSCGILTAPYSAWDTGGAVRGLLSNPARALRIGMRARERARHQFSLTAMERAYAQLVARHTGFRLAGPQA